MTQSSFETLPTTRQTALVRLKNPEDRDAWEEFFQNYGRAIFNVARRKGLSDADAEDVLQKTMAAVVKDIQKFEKKDQTRPQFRAWLFAIARHRLGDHFRSERRQPPVVPVEFPNEERTDLVECVPDPRTPLDQIVAEEHNRALRETALSHLKARLKARQYQIAYEIFVNERTPKEAAERLGVPAPIVSLVKFRIKQRFEKALRTLMGEV